MSWLPLATFSPLARGAAIRIMPSDGYVLKEGHMPTTKLTLSADKSVVVGAKRLAAKNHTSLSAMFSRVLRFMARAEKPDSAIGPVTRRATGLVRLPSNPNDAKLVEQALADKYAP
jgi:hypothetical protein